MPFFVVTGGAGALGSAIVRHLVSEGHATLAVDIPQASAPLATLQSSLGPLCLIEAMDATSPRAWRKALERLRPAHGSTCGGALVAGGYRGGTPFHAEVERSTWDAMFHLNLETAQQSLRALLPDLIEQKSGSLVVIGSRAVERPWTSTGGAAYAASKSALVTLAQVIASEVVEYGVRINAVMPSVIDTEANRRAMPDAPHETWVQGSSIAQVVAFLLSPAARDISGGVIPVYGRA